MRIKLERWTVEYLSPALERCPELVAIDIQGTFGFYNLLQSLQYNENGGRWIDHCEEAPSEVEATQNVG